MSEETEIAAWEIADSLKRAKFVSDIMDELERARTKHPDWPEDLIHAAAVVAEEANETLTAALQHTYEGGSLQAIHDELIQTGAMVVRMLMNLPQL